MKQQWKRILSVAAAAICISVAGFSSATAQDVKRGGELVVALDIEPASLDPIFSNAPGFDGNVYNIVYDRLVEQNADGTFRPSLAESWTIDEAARTIDFQLRSGVKYHDGADFDAEAVKFALDRALDKEMKSPRSQDLKAIDSVEVLSPLSVRLVLNKATGALLSALSSEVGGMVSPAAVRAAGTDYARNPVGTGPFSFVEWRGGDRMVFKANPAYWGTAADGAKLPYLDSVTIRFIQNSAVRIIEARSGTVHLGNGIQVKDYESIQQERELKLLDSPTWVHQWLAFNVTKPPFDNLKLRLAVAKAINRSALEGVISKGMGEVTPTLVPSTEWIFDSTLQHPEFDVAEAAKLREEAGFDETLRISFIQRDPDTQIAQILQAMLAQAGFKVELEVLERQALIQKILNERDYHISLGRWNVPRADPSLLFGSNMGRSAGLNFAGYTDEALFDAIDAAEEGFDVAKRKEGYRKVQELLLADMPYSFLFQRPLKDVASTQLGGLARQSAGAWILNEAHLK